MKVCSCLKQHIISVPAVCLLVSFLSFLLYGFKFPFIVHDMAWYISHAASLLHGHGLAGPDLILDRFDVFRGPVFPALIAMALAIDFSPDAAFWVVKIGAILMPPTIFLFCVQLQSQFKVFPDKAYGILWGIITTIGLFSIAEISVAIEWHIDAWWILFCLWSLMFALNAFAYQSVAAGALAGLLLSLGFLTKEVSLLYCFVVFILPVVIPSFRKMTNLRVMLAVIVSAALPVMLWFFYLDSRLSDYRFLGAQGGSVPGIIFDYLLERGGHGFWKTLIALKDLILLMLNNPANGVLQSVPYGGIFLFAWLFYGMRAARSEDSRVIILASGVSLPLIAYNAIQGWGFRYGLSFYVFASPALGFLVIKVASLLYSRRYTGIVYTSLALILLWTSIHCLQPNSRKITSLKILKRSSIMTLFQENASSKKNEFSEDQRYHFFASANAKKSFEIIENDFRSIKANDYPLQQISVMIDNLGLEAVTSFYSKRLVRVSSMPILLCYQKMGILRTDFHPEMLGNPIVQSFFVEDDGTPVRAMLLHEKIFHAELKKRSVNYFIDTGHIEGLSDYLEASPAFEVLGESQSGEDVWTVWKTDVGKLSAIQFDVIDNVYAPKGTSRQDIKNESSVIDFTTRCLDALQ